MVFPVIMYGRWELDHKEVWAPKYRCFQTVVLEKTLESPLDCKEIKPFNPKGNQTKYWKDWSEAEAPIRWPPDAKNWLIGNDPVAGKDWRQSENGAAEDEITSLTQWTWIWANSRRQWRTGKPGMLWPIGVRRVKHNSVTEQHQQPSILVLPLSN